ncbi:hypothetical protein [Psychrobacter cibarius]|uniref:hypothetical protein n=1 Tax=Psychrobacter cibarius TaxID=282669 RepID=UPI0019189565|nr:hypothetical protein [Psychrobacter cibarius]
MSDNKSQEYVFDVNDLPKDKNELEVNKSYDENSVNTPEIVELSPLQKILERGRNLPNTNVSNSVDLAKNDLSDLKQELNEKAQVQDLETQEEKLKRFRTWERERDEKEGLEREYPTQESIEIDNLPDFDIPNETENIQELPRIDLSRTLTDDEYLDILADLNEDAENKNYVFLFGIPGSGKSYIIASLLKYMEQSDLGQSRLDLDKSNDLEKRLYNRMIMSFTDPKKYRIESNATLDFNRFNIIFTPKGNKPEKTITFLDISGEACQAIYQGDSSKYTGDLPDFLRVVLESDINSTFLLISECQKGQSDDNEVPQDRIIKAFYDKILETQVRESRKYKKILLMSKWDNLPKNEREETDVVQYIQEHLPVTMSNFLAENHDNEILNAVTSYSVGDFRGDRLIKFNEERPRVLFEFLYESISGQPLRKPESQFKKFYRYLMGS